MIDYTRMSCLPIVQHLHIVPISMVDNILYPTIRKSNSVLLLVEKAITNAIDNGC